MTLLKDLTKLRIDAKLCLTKLRSLKMPMDLQELYKYKRELIERRDDLLEIVTPASLELQQVAQKIQTIDNLLRLEGEEVDDMGSVRETAVQVLETIGKPVHYRELLSEMEKRGYRVPGKDPATNLLAHLLNDSRITKAKEIDRGYYKLKKWG